MRNIYLSTPDTIQETIKHIIEVEGGYTNNPDDTGGETTWGITKRVSRMYSDWWHTFNWDGDMKTLPVDLARAIYLEEYYYSPKFYLLEDYAPLIVKELTDTGVNCGTGTSTKFLQRVLNSFNNKEDYYDDLVVDGLMGSKTVDAYKALCDKRGNAVTENVVYNCLNALQTVRYVELTEKREKNETFAWGWIANRVDYTPF